MGPIILELNCYQPQLRKVDRSSHLFIPSINKYLLRHSAGYLGQKKETRQMWFLTVPGMRVTDTKAGKLRQCDISYNRGTHTGVREHRVGHLALISVSGDAEEALGRGLKSKCGNMDEPNGTVLHAKRTAGVHAWRQKKWHIWRTDATRS